MPDAVTIRYRAEFARLPDAAGKPIGHSAALMLSQFDWLRENRPLPDGWIECSQKEMLNWGFTRTEQETCRRVLGKAGYIEEKRGGDGQKMRFRVTIEQGAQNAETLQSEFQTAENLQSETMQSAENPQSAPISDCGKPAYQTAENLQSETRPVSIKASKTPEETTPPISPPSSSGGKRGNCRDEPSEFAAFYQAYPRKEARPKACQAWKRISPDAATVQAIMAGLERAKRQWRQSDPEFIPHPATWLNQRRWEDEGLALDFSAPRGSPAVNGHSPPPTAEQKEQRMSAQVDRILQRQGYT